MGLKAVNEAAAIMNGTGHHFTEEEKEFVVQYAFKSGSKEKTNRLIDELTKTGNEADSKEVMLRFKGGCGNRPDWVEQVENLLVSLEMYRLEQERAIMELSGVLAEYGIGISADEIRSMKTEELKHMVKKKTEAR